MWMRLRRCDRPHIVIINNVIYVTFSTPEYHVMTPPKACQTSAESTGKPMASGVAVSQGRVLRHPGGQGPLLDEFNQFLPFGLTLSLSPPTVTVRNRYRKRRLAGKPRKNAI
jgi:hypothetical protein